MFANFLLHIVVYAIILLAALGVAAMMENRKLQAKLWITSNPEPSYLEMLSNIREKQELSYGTPEYELVRESYRNIHDYWQERNEKAERTIRRMNFEFLPDVGLTGTLLNGMILILGSLVLFTLVFFFFDSLDLDFTRLLLALKVLKGLG